MSHAEPVSHPRSLRERKQERTRQALVDAAIELFESTGYEQTTVADIAARAEVGRRTFFSYFASKEELLFPPAMDARVQATIEAIATRDEHERPADVLLRALEHVVETDTDMTSTLAALRMRLIQTVPAVRGQALQNQRDAERDIARHLHAAFPDELNKVEAAALVGAFIGAAASALQVLLEDTDTSLAERHQLAERARQATDIALRPWRRAPSTPHLGDTTP
jgi:AcrR family transcriptional regulator